MKENLLIVVDMQNDFIDGSLGTKEAQAIVPKVVEKIKNWDGPIILTQDTHSEDYLNTREGRFLPVKHCIENTWGWELNQSIKDAIREKSNTSFIFKDTFGVDYWGIRLYGYDSITLIGLCTDICVISNAIGIKNEKPEVDIYVDSSCCAGVTPAKHEAALEVMRSCQIEVY